MNLNETIISSVFLHLILLLLIAAVSSRSAGLSGIQNVVVIDLAKEYAKDPPAARSDTAYTPPDSGLLGETVGNPPEESKQILNINAANKVEAEKPLFQREGFTSLEAYRDFIILHSRVFRQQAGRRVNELLSEAFKVNTREFYGGTAVVSLEFGPDGKLSKVLVDSTSPDLKAFLKEIGWGAMPAPADFSLGSAGVQIEFSVREGYMNFNISNPGTPDKAL